MKPYTKEELSEINFVKKCRSTGRSYEKTPQYCYLWFSELFCDIELRITKAEQYYKSLKGEKNDNINNLKGRYVT